MSDIESGDYVLATKYSDGDSGDQWCVGFYDSMLGERHRVVDANGDQFRYGGFRRVTKISKERGEFIIQNTALIESSSRSLYWWLRRKMSDKAKGEE